MLWQSPLLAQPQATHPPPLLPLEFLVGSEREGRNLPAALFFLHQERERPSVSSRLGTPTNHDPFARALTGSLIQLLRSDRPAQWSSRRANSGDLFLKFLGAHCFRRGRVLVHERFERMLSHYLGPPGFGVRSSPESSGEQE